MIKVCNKCGFAFDELSFFKSGCKHSAVNQKFGKNICIYCCKKCKYGVKSKALTYADALECIYDKEQ